MDIRIEMTHGSSPAGKLADAELVFTETDGVLAGLRLVGFGVWQAKRGGLNVTFPARQHSVNGERRSYALLRPADAYHLEAHDAIKDAIIGAYETAVDVHRRAEAMAAAAAGAAGAAGAAPLFD